MSMVAIITARGGSKRIPRKNIREFMGKPMLAYAIEAARGSGLFDEVMVSTEDAEIAEIAKQRGAAVPFMRSSTTADDFSATGDVLKEVLACYHERKRHFDTLCCIYPCVPFLTDKILKEAGRRFLESECDVLTPVVRFSFPIQRAFRVNSKGFLEYREPQYALSRSQDLESMYHDVGMFYFMKSKVVEGTSSKIMPFEMEETCIQDIDTLDDWKLAEQKYRILHNV